MYTHVLYQPLSLGKCLLEIFFMSSCVTHYATPQCLEAEHCAFLFTQCMKWLKPGLWLWDWPPVSCMLCKIYAEFFTELRIFRCLCYTTLSIYTTISLAKQNHFKILSWRYLYHMYVIIVASDFWIKAILCLLACFFSFCLPVVRFLSFAIPLGTC